MSGSMKLEKVIIQVPGAKLSDGAGNVLELQCTEMEIQVHWYVAFIWKMGHEGASAFRTEYN